MKRSQLVKVIKEELGRKQTLKENLDAIITKYIETDDATELKAYFKSLPDRARTKLAKIFKIELDEEVGYSKYAPGGITKGGTTADFTTILTNLVKGGDQITRGNKSIDKGDPQKGNDILDRGNPDIPLDEENGLEKYTVFFYTNDDDYDWDVMATSEEDAIAKVKSGEAKGPYDQTLPRLARKFSAKKVG